MVRVQMLFSMVKSLAQFLKHFYCRRRSQIELPEVLDDVRPPTAIDASPFVALKAENSQPPMIGVIAALCRITSPLILLTPCLPFMHQAKPLPIAERLASRQVAGTLG